MAAAESHVPWMRGVLSEFREIYPVSHVNQKFHGAVKTILQGSSVAVPLIVHCVQPSGSNHVFRIITEAFKDKHVLKNRSIAEGRGGPLKKTRVEDVESYEMT